MKVKESKITSGFLFFKQRKSMAKKKKGYQELQKYRVAKGDTEEFIVDLKKYADEYAKLLKKRYSFVLSNGQKISLKFEEGNFYHLLGFHKFTKTVFAQMISQDTYSYNATDFYNDVLNENIKFDWWNEEKVPVPQNLLKAGYFANFIDQENESEAKNVINRRFPYFTYDNVMEMFNGKVVIDYNAEDSESDVQADKIFFVFLSEAGRNLNLCTDGGANGYFPTTFFLENKRDWFKYKKDGTLSNVLDILGVFVEDMESGEAIWFKINWRCVRTTILNKNEIESYGEMKKLFNKEDITLFYMKQQITVLQGIISQQAVEMTEIDKKIRILNLETRYLGDTHDQDTVLELMDFGIDVEAENLNKAGIMKERKSLQKKLSMQKEISKKHEKKIRKIQSAMLSIQQLDILMVKSVYNQFVNNSAYWREPFWGYFVDEYNWIELNIKPAALKKIYRDWGMNVQ